MPLTLDVVDFNIENLSNINIIDSDIIGGSYYSLVPNVINLTERTWELVNNDNISIGTFSDITIDTGSLADGDILRWSGDTGSFSNVPLSMTMDLLSLTDFQFSTPNTGDIIQYNGTDFVFTPLVTSSSLADLTDTDNINTATDGQVLTFNGNTGKYEPQDPTGSTAPSSSLGGVHERTAGQRIFHEGVCI